jgi:glycosyltransferase involved in cell wall biosynthesis
MAPPASTTDLSLIIPCYNEGKVLPLLKSRLLQSLESMNLAWEVVLVDDGSKDSTYDQLIAMHQEEPRFKVIALSRNFGHQAAIYAGIYHANGRVVAIMDADLQDPPEFLATCIAKLKEGYDVIFAIRRKRKENFLKRAAYSCFYRLLKSIAEVEIPLDTGDFCVMDRKVVNALKRMPERNLFVRGLRAWAGFRQIGIEYNRDARAAGETKYPFRKLLRLAMDGVFAFSPLPLRLATYLGFGVLLISAMVGIFILVWKLSGFRFMGHTASEVPGWTSMISLILFLSGIQFLILGCMGEYIGRIYSEVKQRPRWIVRETLGLVSDISLPKEEQ